MAPASAEDGRPYRGGGRGHKRHGSPDCHNRRHGSHVVQCNMSAGTSTAGQLDLALADYGRRWPDEAGTVAMFAALLCDRNEPFARTRLAGHFTASAWLVSQDRHRVLLTHHRKLDRWLQLGGHADGEQDLLRVALLEAEEESGLTGLSVEPGIFDIDRHWIPEHKGVPAHWHYDVRYVLHAGGSEEYVVSDESHDLAWRVIAGLVDDNEADPSLRRMAVKWIALLR